VIDVQTGTVRFGNVSTFNSGTQFTGAGLTELLESVTFNGDIISQNVDLLADTAQGTATLHGTFDLPGGSTIAGNYTVAADGELNFNGNDLTINGSITDAGAISWTRARVFGSGSINVSSGGLLTLSTTQTKELRGPTLNNSGIVRWQGDRDVLVGSPINNLAGGLIDIQNNQALSQFGTATLNNSGTIRKSTGNGTTTIDFPVGNSNGTVEAASGTLTLASTSLGGISGTTITGGTWNAVNGATLNLTAVGNLTTNSGQVTLGGAGASFQNLSTLATNNGAFTVRDGGVFVTGGSLLNAGTLTTSSTGILNVNGNLSNTGTLVLGSAGTVNVTGNFNQPGSELVTEITGTPASGLFGRMNVTGTSTLGGQFTARLPGGFGPTLGDSYTVVNLGNRVGNFGQINLPRLGRAPAFEALVDQTTLVLNTRRTASDLSVQTITVPATAVPGQDVTIGYTAQNRLDTLAEGNWIDSVYLSTDSVLDAGDKLIGRASHSGDVPGGTTYNGTLTAPLPPVIDGRYRVIVVVDSRGLVPDVDRSNNSRASTNEIAVQVPVLLLNQTATGTIAAGQDVYFRIDVPPGDDVRVVADLPAQGSAELYLRYANVPDRTTFDLADQEPRSGARSVTLPAPQAGPYYVLLHGIDTAGAGQTFQLTAQQLGLELHQISPSRGSNAGSVTIAGAGFSADTTVTLERSGSTDRSATDVRFRDSNTLFATFDLRGLTPDNYDVRIRKGGQSASSGQAFTVTAGVPGRIETRVTLPSVHRGDRMGLVIVDYANVGETDVPAPLLQLSATGARLRFFGDGEFTADPLLFLGINHNGAAGTLPAHTRGSITLEFFPTPNSTLGEFVLSQVEPTDDPYDWESIRAASRPSYVSPEAWSVIWDNFKASVGTTQREFLDLLSRHATYLSQFGIYLEDIDRLIGFELQRASNVLTNRDPLLLAQDAITQVSDPDPTFGMAFSRRFQNALAGRFRLGALGRGWVHAWEVQISAVSADGRQVDVLMGGEFRNFQRQSDGTFRSPPGDFGVLTLEAGAYRIREPGGYIVRFRTDGLLDSIDDPNGNRITTEYTNGRLTRLLQSNGATFQFNYNAAGRLIQLTDHSGAITTYEYDASGEHLVRMINRFGTTAYAYEATSGARQHAITSVTYANGTHRFFEYDARGRLTREQLDGNAGSISYAYGPAGEFTVTDAGGGSETAFLMIQALWLDSETVREPFPSSVTTRRRCCPG
jgi:YD repeat-containing protein